MRKVLLLLIIFCLWRIACHAQKDFNVWCFGKQAGLDFNTGSPVAFSGVMMSTEAGNSSIADSNGSLLFYTDGVSVWNRHDSIMPHGTMLWGGSASTQSALIVKKPCSATLYYIFTTDEALGPNGFCYSIVDMSLNGGLGDVTVKNVQLFTPCAEKVCATLAANDTDVWVLGHETGNNKFHAYLITSVGLNTTPVISSAGSVHPATSHGVVGYMKFSPDGKHLALAVRYQYIFELFDFNSATGIVSNPVTFTADHLTYGVEFSPDNSKLYLTDTVLYQYDITGGNGSSIISTKTKISNDGWALQLGPDKKIYCATFFTGYLDVINSPDSSGGACNYAANAVSLGASISASRLGLPSHIASPFKTSQPTDSSSSASGDTLCVVQKFKLYPNPVSDKLMLSLPTQQWSGDITITNMLGEGLAPKIMYESENIRSIPIMDLSNGIYIIKLNACSQTVIKKFTVIH
jgi:hypothetical protein